MLKIEGKTGKNLVKVWDKRWSKLPEVMKWFAILTILSFCYVCDEKIGSVAQLGRKILNLLVLARKKFFDNAYVSPEKFFGPPPSTTFSGNNPR